jgi:glycosyltransferase involved in cell wall biosynthesis
VTGGRAVAPSQSSVALDLSGGRSGGAGRFREQWLKYAAERPELSGVAIGLGESVSPKWLIRRELSARGRRTVISANNVGFWAAGDHRITLLRNANHFLTAREWEKTGHLLGRSFTTQVRLVRAVARRSAMLVVPSNSMGERVAAHLPELADRLVVRFHPLEAPAVVKDEDAPPIILCPIVDSPFKKLARHLEDLHLALGSRDIQVISTSREDAAPLNVRADKRFQFIGTVSREDLARIYASATAVYYPTHVESFGYPLAEARASGLPVIAQQSPHNAEIAGSALCGYSTDSAGSLRDAIDSALSGARLPDPDPFGRDSYFSWLLTGPAR